MDEALVDKVVAALGLEATHYSEIAQTLSAEPWDILDVCRRLVREGKAREEEGRRRGYFASA